ncbi:hypothetical protein [Phreatobacter sp. AB_2022a]|uniref:hypothetical protein n=1 Tax=Phreatobacter sp. AB_2022a TaxID=3003134 RepID=UPI002286E50C|nr:hypothetical protein [Phreatobacter sp. AB_2022a]MCZ0736257.1 hypothetical protein [Phreatobacter sp. AB_2022a]
MLVPIDETNMERAHALLARGFPSRQPAFWVEGLKRQAEHHARRDGGAIGQLLRVGGDDVGVILTMRSWRADAAGGRRKIVNLSSWYVEEAHRWLAPRMLKSVLSEPDAIHTDLTPSENVEQLNGRLGLMPWNDGVLLVVLPAVAWRRDERPAEVVGLDAVPRGQLPATTWTMLEDHQALGCICIALRRGEAYRPLIFTRTRRKGLPTARLIYADSKGELAGAIAAVSRFLLAHAILMLEVPARRDERLPAAWFSEGMRPTFARGAIDPDSVDHAYSELVLLQY